MCPIPGILEDIQCFVCVQNVYIFVHELILRESDQFQNGSYFMENAAKNLFISRLIIICKHIRIDVLYI